MWKFRGEVIFTLALLFAVKAIIFPDVAAVCGVVLFLVAHYVDRFFDSERVESKIIKRVQAVEEDHKTLKQDISRLNLSVGIRAPK